MALVVFSFTGSSVIKVTGGATSGVLGSIGDAFIVAGASWASSLGSKGETIRIKDLRTGGSVLLTRTMGSFDAGMIELPQPQRLNGLIMTCPNGIEALIYLENY